MDILQELITLHLADSALPTGGFAYSAGMEAVLEFGLVDNEDDLKSYIEDFTRQSIYFDFPYVLQVFNTIDIASDAEIGITIQRYDASFTSSSMYQASINMGRNWIRILGDIFEENEILVIKEIFKNNLFPLHYLFVCTISFKILGLGLEKLKLFHVNNIIRDQVSAAIRLGAIGPMQGHRLQYQLSRQLTSYLHLLSDGPEWESKKTGTIPDIAQMLQKNVYSKLFKN